MPDNAIKEMHSITGAKLGNRIPHIPQGFPLVFAFEKFQTLSVSYIYGMRIRQRIPFILFGLATVLLTFWSCSEEKERALSNSGIRLENDSEKWLDETANFEADPAA